MSNPTKIAIVTGASRGLGKNTALKLAEHGHDVILTYLSGNAAAEDVAQQIVAMGRKARILALNVETSSSFEAFAVQVRTLLKQHWQREQFNILINNAGTGVHASFAETTEAQFDQMVNIHLKGTYFLTQKLLPLIADGGRIVNLSSGLTRFSFPGYSAYAAMKGGIEVLSHYMAKELGARGIAVNVVAPGAIETDFGGGAIRDNKQLNSMIASQTALGRVGLPEDIGGVIASLVSDENRWVNAQRIEVSGGIFI